MEDESSPKFQGSPWNKTGQPDLLQPAPMTSSPSRSDPAYSVKRKPFVDLIDNFERSSSPPLLSFNANPASELQQVFKEEILKGEWNNGKNDDHSTLAASVISSALLESEFRDVPPRAYSTPPTRSNLMSPAPDLNYALKNLDIRNVIFYILNIQDDANFSTTNNTGSPQYQTPKNYTGYTSVGTKGT